MKMIPIVAVVTEPVATELGRLAARADAPPRAIADLMARNGWTLEALIAGRIVGDVLSEVPASEGSET